MDARRKQVYTGIYRFEEHQLMTLKEQWAAPIEELLEELNQRGEMVTFLGDGVPVFRELIAMEHIPEYLRVSQAERERAEREKEQKTAGTKV